MTLQDEASYSMREFTRTGATREMDPHWSFGRRSFLRSGVASAAALSVGKPFGLLGAGTARAVQLPYSPDYGPLAPTFDEVTGLPLLTLPAGFEYWSHGWRGDLMSDGTATPGAHDGMAVVASDAQKVVLVRNHELGNGKPFAPAKLTYDPTAAGGTTNMVFSTRLKKWLGSWATLGGTVRNCAGGPTPWNSWLSCEETSNGLHSGNARQHGYVFDVPACGPASAKPITDMGCFSHEAVAVDPVTGIIYETEDADPSGFYRFIPKVPGRPAQGGRLQMMKLAAVSNAGIDILGINRTYFDTGVAQPAGAAWDVSWVDIAVPNKPFLTGTVYGGVRSQGLVQGASSLVRGEGCWYGNGVIYACSTSGGGGGAGKGQIFAYDPRRETFSLVFESAGGAGDVDGPDNIAWSPRGSLILCEDGHTDPKELYGLTLDGTHFPFCANNLDFSTGGAIGNYTRPSGRAYATDVRSSEFAGATFHDEWLFFSIQGPDITFAVTGPWDNGAL